MANSSDHNRCAVVAALRWRLAALPLILIAIPACGSGDEGGGRPAHGVLHLDPRLADGGSPAALFAASRKVTAVMPTPDAPNLGPWELVGGKLGKTGGLLTIRADGKDLDGDGERDLPRLVYRGKLEASDVRALAIAVQVTKPCQAIVRWTGSQGKGGQALPLQPSSAPQRTTFNLAGSKQWTGTIVRLEILLTDKAYIVPRLRLVDLLPFDFEWGASPDSLGGDLGLRRRGSGLRRAWPAARGLTLFASVDEVPASGRLSFSVARGNGSLGTSSKLPVRVDGRRPGGEWKKLVSTKLAPARSLDVTAWFPHSAKLTSFAGGPLELRFSVGSGGERSADAPLVEEVLWGEPLVLGKPPADPRPSILLVTMDTTRADALGDGWSPNLDALAADGFTYTDAWATCNSTTASHASILTGLAVVSHGAITNRHALPERCVTLAESFRAAGYNTAAAVSAQHIDSHSGFGQGFDRFATVHVKAPTDGALTLRQVEVWFKEWSELPTVPRFLWVHLFDPHVPYSPPVKWTKAYLAERGLEYPPSRVDPPTLPLWAPGGSRDPELLSTGRDWLGDATSVEYARFRYRIGVAYTDYLFGRLLEGFEHIVPRKDLAVLVTGDHGEGIGDHGVWYDHASLSREILNVPLLLRPPASLGLGSAIVNAPASNTDIVPTLLRLAGVAGGDSLEGRNLLDRAGLAEPRAIFFAHNGLHQQGFREAGRHFVLNMKDGFRIGTDLVQTELGIVPVSREPIPRGRAFLYDSDADPSLEHDLSEERPEEVAAAREMLNRWIGDHRADVMQKREVSADEEAQLQAMGYTGDD